MSRIQAEHIADKEARLFRQWRQKHDEICPDGAVDPHEFAQSSPRILLVLKETNDIAGGDMRDYLRNDNSRPQTWSNAARWVHAIRELGYSIPWNDVESASREYRCQHLASVAAVNIKKTTGSHTSKNRELLEFSLGDDESIALLREQLTLYEAHFVILCGSIVAHAYRQVFPDTAESEWARTSRGVSYRMRTPTCEIEYAHPEARVSDNLLFYGIHDAVREIVSDHGPWWWPTRSTEYPFCAHAFMTDGLECAD